MGNTTTTTSTLPSLCQESITFSETETSVHRHNKLARDEILALHTPYSIKILQSNLNYYGKMMESKQHWRKDMNFKLLTILNIF